ncbi:MAG: hypothetical protein Q4D23_07220, partial [Bacteroidales bacterium]|nr:hypothetical protein [Bacteroidales bacterium]
ASQVVLCPDCECKGTATFLSTQEIFRKKFKKAPFCVIICKQSCQKTKKALNLHPISPIYAEYDFTRNTEKCSISTKIWLKSTKKA